jgi:hypothetical protein
MLCRYIVEKHFFNLAILNETWSVTLREEHRLRVFENRVQKRIFDPKRDEVTGDWRKQHNEELHNFYYSSPNIVRMTESRRMRIRRNCVVISLILRSAL